jgi:hypothetical protein
LVRPHPGPLPQEREGHRTRLDGADATGSRDVSAKVGGKRTVKEETRKWAMVRPHPGPLPQERVNLAARLEQGDVADGPKLSGARGEATHERRSANEMSVGVGSISLSLGERAGVRASVF